jgi:2,4-dienoyl-CoA reductase (NADPH2)
MKAACTVAERGHEVTLAERANELGGQLLLNRNIPGRREMVTAATDLTSNLRALHVNILLGKEVDRGLVREMQPDVVILATGASPILPDIPGIERENVVFAWDILEQNKPTAETVAIIGGGKVGLITAEFLASNCKKVWIIESQKRVDYDISATFKWRHAAWVKEFGINVLNFANPVEVKDTGLVVKDEKGEQLFIEAGTIILGGPRKSQQDMVTALEYFCDELYVIGDAIQPRSMHNAIHEGYKLGVRL